MFIQVVCITVFVTELQEFLEYGTFFPHLPVDWYYLYIFILLLMILRKYVCLWMKHVFSSLGKITKNRIFEPLDKLTWCDIFWYLFLVADI